MGDRSAIEWTDATWNPVRGCSRVSEGCRGCYAEGIAARFSDPGLAFHGFADRTRPGSKWTGKVELVGELLELPLRWRRPRRIFVNSMSDLFHEALPDAAIDAVFSVMAECPQHIFQVLTKRSWRMRAYLSRPTSRVLPNVWAGVSVENQPAADERVPHLVATPAAVRFLSLEPLLSGVSLRAWLTDADGVWCNTGKISWCIVGGESGPKARPMLPRWVDSLRRQCEESETPFFFKQWGAWRPAEHRCEPQSDLVDYLAVERCEASDMVRVGKAAAGAMLHGREWRAFPDAMRLGAAV